MTKPSRHIRLQISYDGTEFSGWQRQDNARTIQQEIEEALSTMTCSIITLHGAGRTDAGVHAEAMVAHFTTSTSISCDAFFRGLNSMLPPAIRIFSADEVDETFHSRFSAKGKEYQYYVFTGPVQSPFERYYVYHFKHSLNLETIRSCLQAVTGTHNFSSFENTGTRDKSIETGRGAVRTLYLADIDVIDNEHFSFRFIGDGFLRNMVRNLVGTLLEVGRGKYTEAAFVDMLHAKNRDVAGPTAPAHGLRLKRVFYTPMQGSL